MSARRARACSSVIRPALRSASIAICLPGIASSVKRAPTSATRPAPLVTTTNWMTTRIRKMTSPTTTLPPTTNSPNALTTLPASPVVRIRRVTDTLIARRNIVVSSSRLGNDAKSSALPRYIVADDDRERAGDVERDQQAEQRRGQRHDEHRHDHHDRHGGQQVGVAQEPAHAGAVHDARLPRTSDEGPPTPPAPPVMRARPASR